MGSDPDWVDFFFQKDLNSFGRVHLRAGVSYLHCIRTGPACGVKDIGLCSNVVDVQLGEQMGYMQILA